MVDESDGTNRGEAHESGGARTTGSSTPPSKGTRAYPHSAAGWGSLKAVGTALARQHVLIKDLGILAHQNKPDGFMCVSCSWAKPAHPHPAEFCESGAKATAWDTTSKRADPAFFAAHTVSELERWHDHDLENAGRLTVPLRWDAVTDTYVPVEWNDAFAEIGQTLQRMAPESVVFYASGRASLETSYMFQLLARLYGCNNLPDSSNMCHESTSVGLKQSIGVGVGTIRLDDFDKTDLMFFFGQNVGTNSPRMLHQLQDARRRGVPIITFNPLREPGLVSFKNPQSPMEMLTPAHTQISTQYHLVRAGGDGAAIVGLCKSVLQADDRARRDGRRVLDVDFIETHTRGFEAFADYLRRVSWDDIERVSGLRRADLEAAADEYFRAKAVIAHYGMGLTQHRLGVQNVRLLCNLLLMRGNIGKPGAGPSPVRGHSNVQGQRTVGITEKPELAPLDQLAAQFGFSPPRSKGMNTVEAFQAMLEGKVSAVINLGGNLVRSVPDRDVIEPAWRNLKLTVNVATHLNRSHLVHGGVSYILPCLSRIEIDTQRSGPQAVSMEDSTGCFHGSRGVTRPASDTLRSEPAIIAGIAKATLPSNPKVDWDAWTDDYAKVRAAIATTYPDTFHDFDQRLWTPGGFPRPLPARERKWSTPSGKAEFVLPESLEEDPDMPMPTDALRLFTLRSDSQFNTTIYDLSDRFRGVHGSRMVLLMNEADLQTHGLRDGDPVGLETIASDGVRRRVSGFTIKAYEIPQGCIGGYYPECNPLIPLWHHARESKVPAAKSIPVRILRAEASDDAAT